MNTFYSKKDIPYIIGTDIVILDSHYGTSIMHEFLFHVEGIFDDLLIYGKRVDDPTKAPHFVIYSRIMKAPMLDALKYTPLYKILD